jgi:histidinol-phosphate phosphatase family protein
MHTIDQSWTLFLDRDGVINKRIVGDYIKRTDEFFLLPNVAKAIAIANQKFGRVVVVTNQQGIGKGLMNTSNLSEVHRYCSELLHKQGAKIDAYYFAPALSSENSSLRKPNTGMALQAKQDFPEIDFNKSIMVGDSNSDIEFGENLGMVTVFVHENFSNAHDTAKYTVNSLYDFIKLINE